MIERIITQFARPELAWVPLVVAMLIIGGVIAIVVTIVNLYADNRRRRLSASSIAEMLDRGFTADEIVDVLRAGGMQRDEDCDALPREEMSTTANHV